MPIFDIVLTEENVYFVRIRAANAVDAEEWANERGWELIQEQRREPDSTGGGEIRVETADTASTPVEFWVTTDEGGDWIEVDE